MYDYEDLAEVQGILDRFSTQETPFVRQLDKKPGQKEARYIHLFASFDEQAFDSSHDSGQESSQELRDRIEELESRVAVLENKLRELFE